MVSLRTFPMNDADIPDQDEMLGSEPANKAAKSQRPRSRARRGWGGRVFATGAFLLPTAGIALRATRHHSKQKQGSATAHHTRHLPPTAGEAPAAGNPPYCPVPPPCD